jgi:hypothetical protein
LCDAFLVAIVPPTVPAGYRLPFVLANDKGGGIAVLAPHDKPEVRGVVVMTILAPDEEEATDASESREEV